LDAVDAKVDAVGLKLEIESLHQRRIGRECGAQLFTR
jgi:hypothetical protein